MDYLTTHASLSPKWRGFAPDFVNYKKCTRLYDVVTGNNCDVIYIVLTTLFILWVLSTLTQRARFANYDMKQHHKTVRSTKLGSYFMFDLIVLIPSCGTIALMVLCQFSDICGPQLVNSKNGYIKTTDNYTDTDLIAYPFVQTTELL